MFDHSIILNIMTTGFLLIFLAGDEGSEASSSPGTRSRDGSPKLPRPRSEEIQLESIKVVVLIIILQINMFTLEMFGKTGLENSQKCLQCK